MLDVAVCAGLGDFELDVAFESAAPFTVLFGPSGAGKSATLAAILGTLPGARGHVRLAGTTLLDTVAGVEVPPHRRGIAAVHQDSRLFPHMPVVENLLYGRRRAGRQHRLDPSEVAEALGISHLLERRPQDLSGGERQRVALGRALLAGPRLLLLDEPFAALDAGRKAETMELVRRARTIGGIPAVLVTHDPDEARALGGRILLIDAGRIVAAGGPELLAAALDIEAEILAHGGGTTRVRAGGAEFTLPAIAASVGARVRLAANPLAAPGPKSP